jgi:superfamily I DNA/RNA helicase
LRAITKSRSHFQAWIYQTVCEWGDFFDCAAEGWSFAETLLHLQDMVKTEEAFYPAIAFIGQWIRANPTGTIDQYLSWLATYDISEEVVTGDDAKIQLMTIHAAKGLEWENVIIAGCNEGLIPSKQAIAAGNVEDERRLMYVAITRARDNLMIAIRPERKEGPKGRIYENLVSRFVAEALK